MGSSSFGVVLRNSEADSTTTFAHSAAHSKPRTLRLYHAMLRHDVPPNKFTFLFLLKACVGLADLPLTKTLHSSIMKLGFDRDLHKVMLGGKLDDEEGEESNVATGAMRKKKYRVRIERVGSVQFECQQFHKSVRGSVQFDFTRIIASLASELGLSSNRKVVDLFLIFLGTPITSKSEVCRPLQDLLVGDDAAGEWVFTESLHTHLGIDIFASRALTCCE
ncbi:hypothetical protein Fmac_021203 [Flemingia macrophylla]|uniref:Uncharacterized protein n=1 Tax=Flemingia macrophylla TaxID=520843 RepID=A0ABD1LW64_9FABA